MRVAIITPGGLPVPATKGGAVETGIQQLIEENEHTQKMNITIFSIYDEEAVKKSLEYNYTKFIFIRETKISKIYKELIRIINKILKICKLKIYFNKDLFYILKIKKSELSEFDKILIKNKPEFVLPLSKVNKNIYLQLHNDFLNKDIANAQKIFNACYMVISNSNFIQNKVLTLKNQNNVLLDIQKNCTDITLFNLENRMKNREEMRKKYFIQEDEVVIMFCGRINADKGIKELIVACKNIPVDKKFKLLIVGSKWFGKSKKDYFLKELEEISKEISEKIIFTGYIPYNQLNKIHALADISVIPSIWEEPAGRVVLEAQASGIPVIVSKSGGIEDYIEKNTAIVVEKDENFIFNLSKSIVTLIDNPLIRNQMGKNAFKYAQTFSAKKYYLTLYELFQK